MRMDDVTIEEHLSKLRRLYVEATPRQRLQIAKQRLEFPEHGPNVLIAVVSAVEGFARSIAMHCRIGSKAELAGIYHQYRFKAPEELIAEYLLSRNLGTPETFFDLKSWRLFKIAVKYRNVLAHECTYLGQDKSPLFNLGRATCFLNWLKHRDSKSMRKPKPCVRADADRRRWSWRAPLNAVVMTLLT